MIFELVSEEDVGLITFYITCACMLVGALFMSYAFITV
jgi:hypothetical protein